MWLQRISIKIDKKVEFDERLCQIVAGKSKDIWNSDWLKKDFKSLINSTSIIDSKILDDLDEIIDTEEVSLFVY